MELCYNATFRTVVALKVGGLCLDHAISREKKKNGLIIGNGRTLRNCKTIFCLLSYSTTCSLSTEV